MPATADKPVTPAPKTSKAAPQHRVRLTLCIDSTPYTLRPTPRADLPSGADRGFILTRTDRRVGKVRHAIVSGPGGVGCSCGDQTFRQSPNGGLCKHLAAARAVGLL